MTKVFECKQCGVCCYGRAGIRMMPDEIVRIAAFLRIPLEDFKRDYCEERNQQTYLCTKTDLYCVFYDEDEQCLIHPVKPRPCVRWPYYAALAKDKGTWEDARSACPGFNPQSSFEDFLQEFAQEEPGP